MSQTQLGGTDRQHPPKLHCDLAAGVHQLARALRPQGRHPMASAHPHVPGDTVHHNALGDSLPSAVGTAA